MLNHLHIGKYVIGEGHPCFIIAEAGVNHNGSLELAKKLIDGAVDAGVDAIKFQSFKTQEVIIEGMEKAPYQKKTTDAEESQPEMLKKLEIDRTFHLEIINYCREKGIIFLSTCADEVSLELLMELKVSALKVASMDAANPIFLEKIAQKGIPVILSTGMCSELEIEKAIICLRDNGCKELAILKCTSCYPTPSKEVNLNAMVRMHEKFKEVIGFSDHTEGLGASPYAVALGAKIIEKHFTLDKKLDGPDHQASLCPKELAQLVHEIRKVEEMLGRSELSPTESEKDTIKALRKHLVSKGNLKKGDLLTRKNIATKRTSGKGIGSGDIHKVIGLELVCDLTFDQPIDWAYLKK